MSIGVGVLMGLAYVLPPGPVTVETVRRSVQGGVRAALAVQLCAVGGDLVYATLMLSGSGHVLFHPTLRFGLGLVGAVLLLYQGIATLRGRAVIGGQVATVDTTLRPTSAAARSWWQYGGSGFALALANPYALLFWLTVGSTMLDGSVPALVGFILGSLLASVGIAFVAGQLHRQRTLRLASHVWIGCGALLVLLGIQLGYTTIATVWQA